MEIEINRFDYRLISKFGRPIFLSVPSFFVIHSTFLKKRKIYIFSAACYV